MADKIRILYFDDIVPNPSIGYGYVRANSIIERLLMHNVDITIEPRNFDKNLNNNKLDLLKQNNESYDSIYWKDPFFNSLLNEKFNQPHDLHWVSRLSNLRQILHYRKVLGITQPLLYDVEALSSHRESLRRQILSLEEMPSIEVLNKIEYSKIAKADIVVSVSDFETSILENKGIKVHAKLGHYLTPHSSQKLFKDREGILFVGSFYNLNYPSPNLDAVNFLVKEIMPLVWSKISCPLVIAGFNAIQLLDINPIFKNPLIKIVNNPGSLVELYASAKVCVVPTRFAAGIPYKVHESLSEGLPVVASDLIFSQLDGNKSCISRASQPNEYVQKIFDLYMDESFWLQISYESLQYIKFNCNDYLFDSSLQTIFAVLNKLKK